MCLAESAGRATPKDWSIIEALEARLPDMDSRKQVFEELLTAKNDISGWHTLSRLTFQKN